MRMCPTSISQAPLLQFFGRQRRQRGFRKLKGLPFDLTHLRAGPIPGRFCGNQHGHHFLPARDMESLPLLHLRQIPRKMCLRLMCADRLHRAENSREAMFSQLSQRTFTFAVFDGDRDFVNVRTKVRTLRQRLDFSIGNLEVDDRSVAEIGAAAGQALGVIEASDNTSGYFACRGPFLLLAIPPISAFTCSWRAN